MRSSSNGRASGPNPEYVGSNPTERVISRCGVWDAHVLREHAEEARLLSSRLVLRGVGKFGNPSHLGCEECWFKSSRPD